jgi:hypothetical protein
MGLYVVANVDGHVISSTDGTNWSEPFNTGISIGKAAVGPDKIIYTGADVSELSATGLFYTSKWNQTPTMASGTGDYSFNEVHYLGEKYVAVGFENITPKIPAFAYSLDGVNWTIGSIDPEYIAIVGAGENLEFTDIGYNGIGYFIIAKSASPDFAGGFYTTDLSQQLVGSNFVNPTNFPVDANQLVYSEYPSGGERYSAWSVFSEDRKTWFSTFDIDPSNSWSFVNGWDLSELLQNEIGLNDLNITEATIGILNTSDNQQYVTWMLSTQNGQIIWWPNVPFAPFISIPKPFTRAVIAIETLNPLEISLNGGALNNEKIKITGATGTIELNGEYFVESLGVNIYRLHTSVELDSPVDASAWSGSYNNSSATASLSRGAHIDALGYGNGKFFAGNDDEEVFMCTELTMEGISWTQVDDQNNSFLYWNDVDYGPMNSCSEQNYRLRLTPQNSETIHSNKYVGEGNLDTSTMIDENGNRVSIQRTGYFDLVDGCGNRKIISVKDGEKFSDKSQSS